MHTLPCHPYPLDGQDVLRYPTPMNDKFREARERLQFVLKAWREERRRDDERTAVQPAPRYDEVFIRGTEWLNGL